MAQEAADKNKVWDVKLTSEQIYAAHVALQRFADNDDRSYEELANIAGAVKLPETGLTWKDFDPFEDDEDDEDEN